jgi:hypothetical protein
MDDPRQGDYYTGSPPEEKTSLRVTGFSVNYSCRKASIGSMRAARMAG